MPDSEVPVPEQDAAAPLLPLGDDEEARRQEGNPRYPWNDHFFRAMCNAADTVAGMLAIVLPPEVTASVDLDKTGLLMLQLLKPSLASREVDVLCETPLKAPVKLPDGSLITGSMVFDAEQQTNWVKNMGHRVNEYVTLIHDAYRHQKGAKAQGQGQGQDKNNKDKEQEPEQDEPGPQIYPLVIYSNQHKKLWDSEMRVHEKLARDPWAALRRYEYLLCDLRAVSEEQIRERTSNPAAQLLVLLLKIVPGNSQVDVDLRPWRGQLEAIRRNGPRGEAEIAWILQYIRNKSETPASRVQALLAPLGPQVEEEFMSTISMVRDETRAEALMEVLAARFGEVPEDVASDVRAATDQQLLAWLRVAATAGSRDEAFSRSGVSQGPRRAAEDRLVPGTGRSGFLVRFVRRWRRSS